MAEIVFISPYQELTNTVNRVIEKYQITNMEVLEGNLDQGLILAQKAVNEGATIVISRGGTYKLLKSKLHTIVLELKLTIFDIENSIGTLVNSKDDIAIMGYDNMIQAYKMLANLNHDHIHIHQLQYDEKVEPYIKNFVKKGIHSFIGDTIVTEHCKKLGYPCQIIASSDESVKMVIDDAQAVLEGQKKESEFNKRYTALMDSVHDGFIATDEKETVIACNLMAEKILNLDKNYLIGKTIRSVPELKDFLKIYSEEETVIEELALIDGRNMAVSNVPIQVQNVNRGSVLIFQEVATLQKFENKIRKKVLGTGFAAKYLLSDIKHSSRIMRECIIRAKKYSQYDSTILIEGATGVGKELFAQGIHNQSSRRYQPFVAVNCAALPESLIESELFGYEEGAFTGSRKGGRPGMFEMAHNGTIFLDEISELPLQTQGHLLRVLQERQIVRVGGTSIVPIDVRIVCASNKNLEKEAAAGKFREDLLYRVNILSLKIPHLDERKEDIPILMDFYLSKYSRKYDKKGLVFSEEVVEYLTDYHYKGNVRELEGLIERGVILADDEKIALADIQKESSVNDIVDPKKTDIKSVEGLFSDLPTLKALEEEYIEYLKNKVSTTNELSEILGINRSTLYRKLNENKK